MVLTAEQKEPIRLILINEFLDTFFDVTNLI